MPSDDPLYFMSKIAEKAGVSGETQGLAAKILSEARKRLVTSGKDPMGISAAALHIASRLRKEKVTQTDIASAANISEVTLRNREKELLKKLNIKYH
jgi:transcription initiation factor TFIIB